MALTSQDKKVDGSPMRKHWTKSSPGVLSDECDSRTGGGRVTTPSLPFHFFTVNDRHELEKCDFRERDAMGSETVRSLRANSEFLILFVAQASLHFWQHSA